MQASIVDLRYKMSEIKKAIGHNEVVAITDRGRVIANILPYNDSKVCLAQEHPFFGSVDENDVSVDDVMTKLRGSRYDTL